MKKLKRLFPENTPVMLPDEFFLKKETKMLSHIHDIESCLQ
jgi:hypothetical protein